MFAKASIPTQSPHQGQKAAPPKKKPASKTIAVNRRAFHDYEIIDTLMAGISLMSSEVKSLRLGRCSLGEGFCRVQQGEIFLYGMTIPKFEQATYNNHAPDRTRKLLLQKAEIRKLSAKMQQDGLTLIPLKLFFNRCWVKVELGLAKGKKLVDKRESLKQKDQARQIARIKKHFQ
jgi:SsrA-binding protein